jgi:histone H3/H4
MAKKETLVVQAKVKQLIKKNKMNCASDVMGALTAVVEHQVSSAVKRAKSNGRKTVRANDF